MHGRTQQAAHTEHLVKNQNSNITGWVQSEVKEHMDGMGR